MREWTAAIVASVVETTRRPGPSSSTPLSWPWANFLHQTCIAGLVKHLSTYTGRISDWLAFVLRPFVHRKQITERCSLRDTLAATLSYILFINHVTVTLSHLILRIKLPKKRTFRNFNILKINRMMPFCNLFMERPSYNMVASFWSVTVQTT